MTIAEPEARVFKEGGKSLPYRLLKPAATEAGAKYPLVILLHGAGERGDDNTKQLAWFWDEKNPSPLTRPEVAKEKAFAIIPQCPETQRWVEVPWGEGSYTSPAISEPLKLTLALIDSFIKENPIDADRVYIGGLSMGGYGAFDAVQRRPDLFAACVSICGAGDLSKAQDIAHVPVWAFHGELDDAVPVRGSREIIDALKKAGVEPRYTEYAQVGHNSWSPAFAEKEFWNWLLAQKRKPKT
jgi:predicted peptidase